MATDPIEALLPSPLRAALARRELLVRRPVAGGRHGAHRSLRPGVGRDFRDYRAYVAGDDPRRLDWRAAARSQRLVVRQTESEEELDLVVLLDGSGGMAYGEGPSQKWQRAGSVAAALSSLALRQGDRVGLALARGGVVDEGLFEPLARRDRLRHIAQLWTEPAAGDCDWPALLELVVPRLRRRSLVVVISDFLDPGGEGAGVDGQASEDRPPAGPDVDVDPGLGLGLDLDPDKALIRGLNLLRAGGHDVALVQILHRDELEFPWPQGGSRVLELEDPRGRRPTVEGPGESLRADYLARLRAHLAWLEGECERGGLLLTRIVTDADPAAGVLELLARLAGVAHDAVSRGLAPPDDPDGARG